MLTRLIAETHAHHALADAPWLGLMASSVNRRDYIRHLALTYGFEAPLEAAFAYTHGLSDVVPLRERARAGLLVQDLLALGLSPARITNLPQCTTITPFSEPTEALGWLYVVERTTLLHDSIRRHLLRRLPESKLASSYLAAAGSTGEHRWQTLGKVLDEYVVTRPKHADPIIGAADGAFRKWREWCETLSFVDP